MSIIDWIFESLFPLFGVTSERLSTAFVFPFLHSTFTLREALTSLFVVVFGAIAIHLLVIVPYRVVLRLMHYKGARFR